MNSEAKRREIQGYHAFAEDSGWSPETYLERVQKGRESPYFNFLLNLIDGEKKGRHLLDCAAGTCWTSHIFSELGWKVVALEMNPSERCGLGCAKHYNKSASFEIVLADCESSPIKDNSFDVVFCHQALHHASNLEQMVKEMARCAKTGGLVIAGGEHIRPFYTSDEEFRKQHPAVEFGANEHAYPYQRYKKAFKKAGLRGIKVIPRGFECEFNTISQRHLRTGIRLLEKLPFVGRSLVSFVLLNFSGAGTEITIYGIKP